MIFAHVFQKYGMNRWRIVRESESCIHGGHATLNNWYDKSCLGLLMPSSKGKRMVVVCGEGSTGLVPSVFLMYRCRQKTGDYHTEMDSNMMCFVQPAYIYCYIVLPYAVKGSYIILQNMLW
jgi:hypothetical protein